MTEVEQKKQNTPIHKKWWFWALICVWVLFLGTILVGSNKDDEPRKVEDENNQQDENSDEIEKGTFKVGDMVAISGQIMTITSVERNWSAEYSKPKDGKEYIRVNITLENKTDDKISYYNTYWKLEDSDGAIDNNAVVLGNDDSLSYGEIAAGGKKTGSLVFEVNKGETGLKIHYQPSFWGNKEAIVEL